MKINIDALKALELKLAEYSKANGAIAEHKSEIMNGIGCFCQGTCGSECVGSCHYSCAGGKK